MITKVISGGQTGVDQAGLRAAKACGIPTAGWAPAGWRTEAGAAPWLADFGLKAWTSSSYAARTRLNVKDSDGTLILEAVESSGTNLTYADCGRVGRPVQLVRFRWNGALFLPSPFAARENELAAWLAENKIRVLNVAGNRESRAPGIGAAAEAFLMEVFQAMKGGAS